MTDKQEPPTCHAMPATDALDAMAAGPNGLGADEAARRLVTHGPNSLPDPPKRSALLRFMSHFHNVLIYVLIASAGVTAALQHWVDTGVILAVVIVNAVIGYVQEGRAEQAMKAIQGMLAPHAAVLRDGRRFSMDAAELVPGDIVLVEAGDRVPADLRLIEARGLKAEEAILTGESVPVDKGIDPVPADAALGGRNRARRRHRHRHQYTDWPDQRDARRCANAYYAPRGTDGPLCPLADGLHIDRGPIAADLRLLCRSPAVCRPVHGGGRPVGGCDSRRPACGADDHFGCGCAGDGAAQRHRASSARDRDARFGVGNLFRQDRHPDPQ